MDIIVELSIAIFLLGRFYISIMLLVAYVKNVPEQPIFLRLSSVLPSLLSSFLLKSVQLYTKCKFTNPKLPHATRKNFKLWAICYRYYCVADFFVDLLLLKIYAYTTFTHFYGLYSVDIFLVLALVLPSLLSPLLMKRMVHVLFSSRPCITHW